MAVAPHDKTGLPVPSESPLRHQQARSLHCACLEGATAVGRILHASVHLSERGALLLASHKASQEHKVRSSGRSCLVNL